MCCATIKIYRACMVFLLPEFCGILYCMYLCQLFLPSKNLDPVIFSLQYGIIVSMDRSLSVFPHRCKRQKARQKGEPARPRWGLRLIRRRRTCSPLLPVIAAPGAGLPLVLVTPTARHPPPGPAASPRQRPASLCTGKWYGSGDTAQVSARAQLPTCQPRVHPLREVQTLSWIFPASCRRSASAALALPRCSAACGQGAQPARESQERCAAGQIRQNPAAAARGQKPRLPAARPPGYRPWAGALRQWRPHRAATRRGLAAQGGATVRYGAVQGAHLGPAVQRFGVAWVQLEGCLARRLGRLPCLTRIRCRSRGIGRAA